MGRKVGIQLPKVNNLWAQNFNFWVVVVGDAIGRVNLYVHEIKLIFIIWFMIPFVDMYHFLSGFYCNARAPY